jgi:thioredoxin reductase (NADPH)
MENNVIVYTSHGCPYCKKVKEQLTAWGVSFEERNVSENYEFFEELQKKKIFGTPATYINGKLVLGFQEAKMKNLLNLEEVSATPKVEETAQSAAETKQDDKTDDDIFKPVDQSILDEVYDLVTIGGGPAGASAAVYAARGRLKTLVIDKAPAAGTLAITHKIANYPGVREELTGLELLTRMQQQAHDFGATFVRTNVLSVDFSDPEIKKLEVPEGTIKAKSVFIAVGAKAPSSKIKGEEEFTGRGVSYCSTCDAAFFKDRTVVVAGDNEEAIHEAEALSKFCKEVRFLIPTGVIKGQADLSTLENKTNVKIYKKYRVKEIQGENSVEKVIVQNDQKELETWDIDGVFLYLAGMKPGTDFLKDAVERDEEGYIKVDDMLQTNVPGVFAGGDARRTPIKQAVISAADGAIAALGADKHVNKRSQLRPQYS